MKLLFSKYQGTGNDFIIIDNRHLNFDKKDAKLINRLCNRKFGIGADGLILLENKKGYDFKMIYFNADGNESSMCGNGGRCIVAFAKDTGIVSGNKMKFIAIDGMHEAEIIDQEVSLKMINVLNIEYYPNHLFLNTGSPHHIEWTDDVSLINVKEQGSRIRNGAPYYKEGANVNFVQQTSANSLQIRTYERGVENETLSCGTGVTAAALSLHHSNKTQATSILVHTQGGNLKVSFNYHQNEYKNIWLTGEALKIFDGQWA